jgi:hypothetical protein
VYKLQAVAETILENLKAAKSSDEASLDRKQYTAAAVLAALKHGFAAPEAAAHCVDAALLELLGDNDGDDALMVQLYDMLLLKPGGTPGRAADYYTECSAMPPHSNFALYQAFLLVQRMTKALEGRRQTLTLTTKKSIKDEPTFAQLGADRSFTGPSATGMRRGDVKQDRGGSKKTWACMGNDDELQLVTGNSTNPGAPMLAFSLGIAFSLSKEASALRLPANATHHFALICKPIPKALIADLQTGDLLTFARLMPDTPVKERERDFFRVGQVVKAYTDHRLQVYGRQERYTAELAAAMPRFQEIWAQDDARGMFFAAWDLACEEVNRAVTLAVHEDDKIVVRNKLGYERAAELMKGLDTPSWRRQFEHGMTTLRGCVQAQRLISTRDDSLSVTLKQAGAKAKAAPAVPAAGKPASSWRERRDKKREAEAEAARSTGSSDSEGNPPPKGKRVRVQKKAAKPAAKPAAAAAPAAAPLAAAAPRNPPAWKVDAYCKHFFSEDGCQAKDPCRFRHFFTKKEKEALAAANPPPPPKKSE